MLLKPTKIVNNFSSPLNHLKGKFFNLLLHFLYYIIPLCLCLYASTPKLHITPDSLHYLYAAKSLVTKGELLNPDQSPYVAWTPLYPLLISLGSNFLGLIWIKIIHSISLLVIIRIFKKIALKVFSTQIFLYFFLLQVIFSPYLLLCSVFVWSEITFIALLLLIIDRLLEGINQQQDFWVLLLLLNLLCLQRNVGVLVVFGVAVVCFYWHQYIFKTTLKVLSVKSSYNPHIISLLILFGGSIAFMLWQVRCELLFIETIHFTQNIFDFPIQDVLYWAVYRIGSWFIPLQISWIIHLLLLITVIIFSIYFFHVHLSPINFEVKAITVIAGIYLIAFILLLRNLEMDGDRYFSPIQLLFMLVISSLLENIYQHLKNRQWQIVFICLFYLWLSYPIIRTIKNILFWQQI